VSSTDTTAFKSGDLAAAIQVLIDQVRGPVFTPADEGYDEERAGFQTAARREPEVIIGAAEAADVRAAVEFAGVRGLPVAVQGTGHGLATVEGGLLITTGRMTDVRVNAEERTAWIEAGTPWARVVEETAPHGLAPLSGSAPQVCAMSYLLGGGLGLMARQYGYAADHVRAIDVVTADGELRHVTAEDDADLFWALRGGRDNFGIATGIEIDLVPVGRLYGGGLFFDAQRAEDILNAWQRWTVTVPEEMTSSLAMVPFPDVPALPEPLRGRHVVHIRIAYTGDAESGEELVAPLRTLGPRLMESLKDMPYSESGSISNDPTDPMPYHGSNAMLSDLNGPAIHALLDMTGPDAPQKFILEIRQLGGALTRPPTVANAVGHRDARFALGVLSRLDSADVDAVRAAHDKLGRALSPWTVGRCLNFTYGETTPEEVSTAYDPDDYRRLTELKVRYDPGNMFRLNHNIPPAT
jgi:hypothetical protein